MRNWQKNEGATGTAQSAALSITIERAERSIARSVQRLRPWAALLTDIGAVAAYSVRPVAAKAFALLKRAAATAIDRFGTRVTVMAAAVAIFIGATGSAAMAIPGLDTQPPAPAQDAVAAVGVASSEEAAAAEPKPVGGLDEAQMANAVAIIEAGEDEGLDQNAWAVALATAMQESKFLNYANENVAESYEYDHQAEGSDHDSVGLFQQRPSSGWGSVEELMDPKTSASKFYDSLKRVDDWEDMPVTEAAQSVQVSAFPDAYAQWESLAWDIIDAYSAA